MRWGVVWVCYKGGGCEADGRDGEGLDVIRRSVKCSTWNYTKTPCMVLVVFVFVFVVFVFVVMVLLCVYIVLGVMLNVSHILNPLHRHNPHLLTPRSSHK